jgi:hypothetical protein
MARPFAHALERPHSILAADRTRAHTRAHPFRNPVVAGLRFALPHLTDVDVHVLDSRGVRVRTLASGEHDAGEHECRWDGFDEAGARCTAGSYVLRLESGGSLLTSRIVALA